MEQFLKVGVITASHGIHGEVKVYPTTDDPQRFKKLHQVFLDTGKDYLVLNIEQVRFFKKYVLLKFKEYHSINDIEPFRQKSLFVSRENAVKLKKNEYFIADLIGLNVSTDEEQPLGMLKDVIQTGANDVYVVQMSNGKDVLIPAIKECILSVNVEEGKMKVHLLKGLLS